MKWTSLDGRSNNNYCRETASCSRPNMDVDTPQGRRNRGNRTRFNSSSGTP